MNPMLTLDEMITLKNLAELRQNTVAKFLIAKHRHQKAMAMGLTAEEFNEVMRTYNDLLDTLSEIDSTVPKFLIEGMN